MHAISSIAMLMVHIRKSEAGIKMNTIDGQEIIQKGRTPNMTGSSIALFLTFDGRWYRVRTRLETLGRFKLRERADELYKKSHVTA